MRVDNIRHSKLSSYIYIPQVITELLFYEADSMLILEVRFFPTALFINYAEDMSSHDDSVDCYYPCVYSS
jgi:hypothetical protein